MTSKPLLCCFVILLLALCCNASLRKRSTDITITSHIDNNDWWLAYAFSDDTITSVSLMDSGAYSSWTPLYATNWGYWVFTTTGNAVTFPVSIQVSDGSQQLTFTSAFTSADPGATYDTQTAFSSGSATSAPTTPPATSAPTNPPATSAPTNPPATSAPTNPPATVAPTNPTNPPATAAPTNPATAAPTNPPATAAPTNPATAAPTNPPATAAPTNPATAAPTNPPATAAPTSSATSPPSSTVTGNPFSGTQYYINPHYTIEVDSSIATYPSLATQMAVVQGYASAFWIDRMSVIDNVTTILTQARMQAAASGNNVMVALVIYDLPARDCAALASNGEIACADATCADGIATYKNSYIDPIIAVLSAFPDITIVTIVEPDSLPNLATNLAVAKCTLAQTAYLTGVAYAISQLSTLSNVHIYVDAAHGGWLGWTSGLDAAVAVFSEVLTSAGGASKIRGFATNVANYQPLGSMTSTDDPCNLASQYNFAINEVKYVSLLDAALTTAGISGMHYIIDTGRNGVPNARSDCSNWCNINKAGLGEPPTSATTASGLTNIDAYFWVKPPGESDGTSDATSPRYDVHCSSVDSVIPAPEAGNWFSSYFSMLVTNAAPAV